ncbi:SdpI family protein [Candidatus Micrarchaeota archaeon]|nr:SdpI family protein [Candidatus Micrarchaeota archaeon]
MNKFDFTSLALIVLMFTAAAYFYSMLPDKIASHWNAQGQVDGWMEKGLALLLMPAITLAAFLLFYAIPSIDPLKKNIAAFKKYYDGFKLVFTLFFAYVFAMTLAFNFGYRFNFFTLLAPGMAVLFYYIGVLMEHAERNWFVGIRTPWTLSSDRVWKKTHRLGALLFKIIAVLVLASAAFPEYAIYLFLIPVIAVAAILFIYSYFEYAKEKR